MFQIIPFDGLGLVSISLV